MSRLFEQNEQFKNAVSRSNAQIFISGGHGGLVTYDGYGGVMRKKGGPMNRLFLLMNDGRLLGDAGLDIEYGHVNFCTGHLASDVDIQVDNRGLKDTCVQYRFKGNEDECGVEVKGGISLLGIPRDSTLVSGAVLPSVMMCQFGDKSDSEPALPYVAWHDRAIVDKRILEWFEIPEALVVAAETGWAKPPPTPMVASLDAHSSQFGASFETQQHLGHVRVFLHAPSGQIVA